MLGIRGIGTRATTRGIEVQCVDLVGGRLAFCTALMLHISLATGLSTCPTDTLPDSHAPVVMRLYKPIPFFKAFTFPFLSRDCNNETSVPDFAAHHASVPLTGSIILTSTPFITITVVPFLLPISLPVRSCHEGSKT